MGERSLAEWLETGEEAGEAAGGRRTRAADDLWDERPPRRPGRLWALAVVPWLVIGAGVLVLMGRGGGSDEASTAAGTAGEHAAAAPAESGHGVEPPGGAADAAGQPEAGATTSGGGGDPEGVPGGLDGTKAVHGDGVEDGAEAMDGVSEAAGSDGPVPDEPVGGSPAAPRGEPTPVATHLAATARPGEAVALAAVHLMLTQTDGTGERYVELATVEGTTPVTHDTAVVTVLAVVLEGADGTWTSRRPARYGVPVRVGDEAAALLGAPWPLPAPTVDEASRPDGAGEDDPVSAAAVVAALSAAGYRDVEVSTVSRLGPGLLRAGVTATPPGEQAPRALEPWLTDHPDPRLLGLGVQPSDEGATTDDP